MDLSYSKRTTEIAVGCLPKAGPPEEIFKVSFPNFAELSTTKGHGVTSPKFECFGKQWTLTLYPGGDDESDDGDVAVFLNMCGKTEDISIEYGFIIRDVDDVKKLWTDHYDSYCYWEHIQSSGHTSYTTRSEILDPSSNVLKDGTLTIEVEMYLDVGGNGLGYEPFVPPNPFLQNMQKMFPIMDRESSDVTFEVKGRKTKNFVVPAHMTVLKACAPTLAVLCETGKGSPLVLIDDVSQSIFINLMRYIYGYRVPSKTLKKSAKDYINAADKYGVINLKLEAETWYCKETQIRTDNVMDNLHFAESKNLALLKEAVMDFFMHSGTEVLEKLSLDDLPATSQSFRDILTAVVVDRESNAENSNGLTNNINALPVNSLRMILHEKGLDVDGTREMLVAAIQKKNKLSGSKRKTN